MFLTHMSLGGFLQNDTPSSPWRIRLTFFLLCDPVPTGLFSPTHGLCLASPRAIVPTAHLDQEPSWRAADQQLLCQSRARPQS